MLKKISKLFQSNEPELAMQLLLGYILNTAGDSSTTIVERIHDIRCISAFLINSIEVKHYEKGDLEYIEKGTKKWVNVINFQVGQFKINYDNQYNDEYRYSSYHVLVEFNKTRPLNVTNEVENYIAESLKAFYLYTSDVSKINVLTATNQVIKKLNDIRFGRTKCQLNHIVEYEIIQAIIPLIGDGDGIVYRWVELNKLNPQHYIETFDKNKAITHL